MRSRAIAVTDVAARALRTAFPVLAIVAIYYALMLALLNIMQALGQRLGVIASGIDKHAHFATWEGPALFPALLALFMIVLAYELWMRKRAAIIVLASFIVVQAVADAIHGMRRPAMILTIMVAAVLLLAIKQFPGKPNPASIRKLKIAVPLFAGLFFADGIIGLYLMRGSLGLGSLNVYGYAYKSIAVAVGASGLRFAGATILFKASLSILVIMGIIYVFFLLFRPYRETAGQSPEARRMARKIVEDYGSDSLAYFNTRADKDLYFYGDKSFLAYRMVGDVALISGDPVGPSEMIPDIMESFSDYCLERGWRLGMLGGNGNYLPYYEELGLKSWYLGDEAIINVDSFSLEGRTVRKLRQSVNKLQKTGYSMEFMYTASIPTHMKHDLGRISLDWRGGKEETGYAMGLGRLMSAEDPDCLLAVAYDPDREPIGFLHFVPMYPRVGYSLDVHRSKVGSPGALSEFMIARTAEFLRDEGYHQMSLHFLALAEHYRDDREIEGSAFYRWVANLLDHILPIVSVYHFDKKFNPTWKKRVILHHGPADLLLVGLSAVSAESALSITRPSDRKK
ncbi:MAG TPA: phosphatidylglycerol lysyltransferase domain-containing protein [Candidatus Anoxymicrobiaceae bacterium]